MPLKVDKMKLPKGKDRRVKLTDEQKQEVREIYATGRCGTLSLAKEYGVSKRLIQFIVDPKKAERQKAIFKENRKYGRYYNREKHRKAIASLRAYKKEIIKEREVKNGGV